jgi:hypothetical protein
MKVTVSIELDLSEVPAFNAANVPSLKLALQNIGMWFNKFHTHQLEKISELYAHPHEDPDVQKCLLEMYEKRVKLSEQWFNNYKVEGTTDDGHAFVFTHKEPNYDESLTVDGQEMED